ncbi:MAG: hypothetical protein ACK5BE_00935 [Alphaproteobacteria bacterium]|jgi:chromosomal replication initiation ATPase DnaA
MEFIIPKKQIYSVENFCLSPINETIIQDIQQNKLLLIGEEKSGKTHLANIWAEINVAEFLVDANHFPSKNLVVENVEQFLGKREQELLHILNLVEQTDKKLLLTTKNNYINFGLADLLSRYRAIPSITIPKPDEELSSKLLIKLFAEKQLKLAPKIMQYLDRFLVLNNYSYKEIFALVEEIDNIIKITNQKLSLKAIKQIWKIR